MVKVFYLALLKVFREADIMVGRKQQAGAFTLEPFADRFNFFGLSLLLGQEMIQPEHHQRIGVSEYAFVNGQLEPSLVDALEDRDRMAGGLGGDLLEAESGAMEKFQGAGDSL